MSTTDDLGVWHRLDNETEELILDGIKFIRPIDHKTVSIDCPVCKTLITTVEDVTSMKEIGACENCNISYYYANREKWEKGWRPSL